MKNLISLIVVFISSNSFAMPEYMKDGTITVTLKDGTKYTYSTNEYMVVKRHRDKHKVNDTINDSFTYQCNAYNQHKQIERHKNIISLGFTRSNRGLNVKEESNSVEISTKKEVGAQLQYQHNLIKDFYLGGQLDTNGGVGLSIGFGF